MGDELSDYHLGGLGFTPATTGVHTPKVNQLALVRDEDRS